MKNAIIFINIDRQIFIFSRHVTKFAILSNEFTHLIPLIPPRDQVSVSRGSHDARRYVRFADVRSGFQPSTSNPCSCNLCKKNPEAHFLTEREHWKFPTLPSRYSIDNTNRASFTVECNGRRTVFNFLLIFPFVNDFGSTSNGAPIVQHSPLEKERILSLRPGTPQKSSFNTFQHSHLDDDDDVDPLSIVLCLSQLTTRMMKSVTFFRFQFSFVILPTVTQHGTTGKTFLKLDER